MKQRLVNLTLAALYLPGHIATGLSGNLEGAPRDMMRHPAILAATILYWLIALGGLALIIAAYLGK